MEYELDELKNGGYTIQWEPENEQGELESWFEDKGFYGNDDVESHSYMKHPDGAEVRISDEKVQLDLYVEEEPDEAILEGIVQQVPIDIDQILDTGSEHRIDNPPAPPIDVGDSYEETSTHSPAKR
jgi:predicted RNA binding protein YcfA (HicA-like mRNA interferase family)